MSMRLHHTHAAFQFGQVSWPARADIMIMTQQIIIIKPRTQDSQSRSLLASGSYTVQFVIVLRTIGVFLVEKQPSRRSLWQANNAISPEQNVFSEVHTMHVFKSLQET